MKNRWRWGKAGFLFISSIILSACAYLDEPVKTPAPQFPTISERVRVMVFPLTCTNVKVGKAITESFEKSLYRKVEVLDIGSLGIYLSSYTVKLPENLYPTPAKGKFFSVADKEKIGENLERELLENQTARDTFVELTKINYITTGQAKELKWGELDTFNFETAESAFVRLIDLKTGQLVKGESFKQGVFEVVTADRIGEKLAEQVNDLLTNRYKQQLLFEKRQKKLRRAYAD